MRLIGTDQPTIGYISQDFLE